MSIPNFEHLSKLLKGFEPPNTFAAFMFITAGLFFFLSHHTIKTVFLLILMAIGPVYVGYDYFTSDKARFKELVPIGENTEEARIEFVRLIQDGRIPIEVDGKKYGYLDPNFIIYKFLDEPAIFVYDKRLKVPVKIEIPELRSERMKQYKK